MPARKHIGRKQAPQRSGKERHGSHPDHSYALTRLNRVRGQLAGIEGMIEERRYCADILIQFRAAMSALRNLEADVFETHLRHCVESALRSSNGVETEHKIRELTDLLAKRTQV